MRRTTRVKMCAENVLADGVLAAVQRMAAMEHGAAGIVSDMPNQTTAWSGLDTTVVRWGHLDAFAAQGFGFLLYCIFIILIE